MNCLLDTFAFLWLALEPKRLSAPEVRAINTAPRRFFSFATIREITLKHSLAKLPLPGATRLWIPRRLDFFQIEILPLQPESVFLGGELPQIHRDPFDRLIAAESIHRRIPVVTCDKPFSDLGANRIW